jgi:hypothetical protein
MARTTHPRLARFAHVNSGNHSTQPPVIVGRIFDGPISEVGKTVQIVISKSNIRTIRDFLDRLEATE